MKSGREAGEEGGSGKEWKGRRVEKEERRDEGEERGRGERVE